MVEKITNGKLTLAIIIRKEYKAQGIQFFSPDEFGQQLGYMNRSQGYTIQPHVHNSIERTILYTQEVLFIRSGKVRADFYDDDKQYLSSTILKEGDVILLADGGHGFEMIEDSEIIEVKQGPYCGDRDKTRFESIDISSVRIENSSGAK